MDFYSENRLKALLWSLDQENRQHKDKVAALKKEISVFRENLRNCQCGPILKIRRWCKGIHPGLETVAEVDLFKPIHIVVGKE